MILGGDEWMRTQYGNNNAYSTWADNEWNWFRWGEWQSTTRNFRSRMHDFVRQSIQLRKNHEYAFAPTDYGSGMPFSWKSPSNGDAEWDSRQLMMHYYNDGNWDEPELAVLINMGTQDVTFTLPENRLWTRLMDTQAYYDLDGSNGEAEGYFNTSEANPRQSANVWLEGDDTLDATYTLPSFSIAIVKERAQ